MATYLAPKYQIKNYNNISQRKIASDIILRQYENFMSTRIFTLKYSSNTTRQVRHDNVICNENIILNSPYNQFNIGFNSMLDPARGVSSNEHIIYPGLASYNNYNEEQPLDLINNIVMHVELTQSRSLSSTQNFYEFIGYLAPNYEPTDFLYSGRDPQEYLKQEDLYMVKSISYYDNSNDTEINSTNPRAKLTFRSSGASPYIRMFSSGYYHIDVPPHSDSPWIFQGESEMGLSVLPLIGMGNHINNYYDSNNPIAHSLGKIFNMRLFAFTTNTIPDNYILPSTAEKSCFFVAPIEIFKYNLNCIGIPWTFSIEEATSKNTDEFTDFAPPIPDDPDDPPNPPGDEDNTSDAIIIESPGITPLNTFNSTYAMSAQQIAVLNDYLWNANWLEDFKLLFAKPIEAVIKISLFPFDLSLAGSIGGLQNIKLGNVLSTAAGMALPNNYQAVFGMGTLDLTRYYGSFLDYSPYTSVSIYLPFIGIRGLDINDVMGHALSIKYAVDILTGSFTAMIWADEQLLYTYTGNMGIDIPITGTNANILSGQMLLTAATSSVGAITGGLSGAFTGRGAIRGIGGAVEQGIGNLAQGQRISIDKGGLTSPYSSLYAPHYCYLIIDRPKKSNPKQYSYFKGISLNETYLLKDLKGYIEVDKIFLNNINATEEEKNILIEILQNGVYIQ